MLTKIRAYLRSSRMRIAGSIPTHMTPDEKRQLYELALASKGVAVEIGSYLGASSCFIAEGLLRDRSRKLVCVDTWQNDAMSEGPRDTFSQFLANVKRYDRQLEVRRGRSSEIAKSFQGDIGFLFLDGDHEYEGVRADWEGWSPHLVDGATVVLHDSGWAEGVQRIIREELIPRAISFQSLPNMFWATLRRI
jgi:predicted O-methyltransferase YrrM